jgi:hypothetical protein
LQSGVGSMKIRDIDYEAVIAALGDMSGREVIVAIQFSDASLDPIALIEGRLRPDESHHHRFSVGDAVILVRAEDVVDGDWVEGLGEEPALRIDVRDVQITVSPGTPAMADLLDGWAGQG